MNRSLVRVAAAALVVVALGMVFNATADQGFVYGVGHKLETPGDTASRDSVTGGGQHPAFGDPAAGNVNTGLQAHSGPSGEDPQGHISFTYVPPDPPQTPSQLRAVVTCLHVIGNQAFIAAVTTGDNNAGTPVLVHVVDNGNPEDGNPPDLIRGSFSDFVIPPSADFPCGFPILGPVPISAGNIRVQDAP